MADVFDSATRSRMMSGIRGKDTKPEILVRQYLHARGFRYRLHSKKLPGKPDLVLPKYRAAIFVHGCFWHRHQNCRLAYKPKSRKEFWQTKFEQNIARDKKAVEKLLAQGWRVMTIWECALRDSELRDLGLETIVEWIKSDWPQSEFPPTAHMST